jgi:GNAT superfamily N-acetyltransferase
MSITIRPARIEDSALILRFITELAIYERAEDQVAATIDSIADSLFSGHSPARALICEVDGEPAGFAVYFFSYSTWLARRGLYLEDLYVSPSQRGVGAGKRMLQHLAQLAVDSGCGRFEWSVLDWNQPAIDFYVAAGAKPQDEWVRYRLEGAAISAFASGQASSPAPALAPAQA